jgi:hypothetical protein
MQHSGDQIAVIRIIVNDQNSWGCNVHLNILRGETVGASKTYDSRPPPASLKKRHASVGKS